MRDGHDMIMLSRDRMAFGGPQVSSDLLLGGYAIYICVDGGFDLTLDGMSATRRQIAIVPPFTKHRVAGPPSIRAILAEAETVSPDILDDASFSGAAPEGRAWAERIEAGFSRWKAGEFNAQHHSFDGFFFGQRLRRRGLDPRVAHAAERLGRTHDGAQCEIASLAREVALSPSRLRHLFCEQIGVPIRSYRSWKRLRNAICLALRESSLLQLAMAAGYADSTHLCHSVKLYFGEQPTFVWTHWRNAGLLQIGKNDGAAAGEAANDRHGPAPMRGYGSKP